MISSSVIVESCGLAGIQDSHMFVINLHFSHFHFLSCSSYSCRRSLFFEEGDEPRIVEPISESDRLRQ